MESEHSTLKILILLLLFFVCLLLFHILRRMLYSFSYFVGNSLPSFYDMTLRLIDLLIKWMVWYINATRRNRLNTQPNGIAMG